MCAASLDAILILFTFDRLFDKQGAGAISGIVLKFHFEFTDMLILFIYQIFHFSSSHLFYVLTCLPLFYRFFFFNFAAREIAHIAKLVGDHPFDDSEVKALLGFSQDGMYDL